MKKMKRPITKAEYVISAFFALIALLPFATADNGRTIDILPPMASVSLPTPAEVQSGAVMPSIVELPTVTNPSVR